MRGAELQLDRLDLPFDGAGVDCSVSEGVDAAAALKREVAERLAAHRSRRGRHSASQSNLIPMAEPRPARHPSSPATAPPTAAALKKSNRIAAAVAERYAQTPSYREFLAAEAARALAEANARAEIAARNAQAVAAAQQQLLAELDLWTEPDAPAANSHPVGARGLNSGTGESGMNSGMPTQPLPSHPSQHPPGALRVRLYEDAGIVPPQVRAAMSVHPSSPGDANISVEELLALDDEIAFRRSPQFPPSATPPVPIPANLLEFPRQLVAPRKARPRIAEGPLREDADTTPDSAQLRIFEVQPSQIATQPSAVVVPAEAPVWSSIRLDAHPEMHPVSHGEIEIERDAQALTEPMHQPDLAAALPFATASLGQRAMAALMDACILGFTFLAVAAGFVRSVPALPPAPIAAMAAVATLLVLFVLYQMLFFTFACATPGMRYARIGLCTFADENPTRAEMRRRTWALLLSACPLGLGFVWALLDEDRLAWHDRMTRMYQRGY